MPLNNLLSSAGRVLKSSLGVSGTQASINRGATRMDKAQTRLQNLRKLDMAKKDVQIRGTSNVSSSRDYINKSLGRQQGPQGGTSLARSSGNSSTNTNRLMPPMRGL